MTYDWICGDIYMDMIVAAMMIGIYTTMKIYYFSII